MVDFDSYLFHQGTHFRAYDYLGCNLKKKDGDYVYSFRVWAPNADTVALISDFSGWDAPIKLNRITKNGVWELLYASPASLEGLAYKFRIYSGDRVFDKGDPYARFSRGGADGASIICLESSFAWNDDVWLKFRRKNIRSKGTRFLQCPINIYELHLGSFMRHDDGSYMSYREMADILPTYVKSMGFTHVEILPITEFPYDGSWGYQVCSYFAPTSRFGSPDDFRYFVDSLHRAGIGIIMDWVPAHFPKDAWGLYEFDGQALYEYQGADRKESASWGTRFFDLGREEIQSFLISSALYFIREFHIDGLRVDAVASMLYLDYDRLPGEWVPNVNGENISLEAVAFFKKLNSTILTEHPDVLMIAEESGDYGGLTTPVSLGGLGFSMKWNMGWANDFYKYLSVDPLYRRYHHKALNFPLMYAFSENYCLPISHDEVVHGKKSFVDKMYGSFGDKLKQMRAALLLMMTYPGKKMMFMGTEYAQFREWDFDDSLEWFMLDYPAHANMREFVRALNGFYLEHHELWKLDFTSDGFLWLLPDEAEKNCLAYRRYANKKDSITVAINFSGVDQEITFNTQRGISMDVIFATDIAFAKASFPIRKSGRRFNSTIVLPPFSGMILTTNTGKTIKKI